MNILLKVFGKVKVFFIALTLIMSFSIKAANATAIVEVYDNSNSLIGSFLDGDGDGEILAFSGNDTIVGLTKDDLGSSSLPEMELSIVILPPMLFFPPSSIASVHFTDTGFLSSVSGFDSAYDFTGSGNITLDTYFSASNGVLNDWAALSTFTGQNTEFALRIIATVSPNTIGSVHGGFQPVPEPSSILLLGIGLISAGFYSRRKKNNC